MICKWVDDADPGPQIGFVIHCFSVELAHPPSCTASVVHLLWTNQRSFESIAHSPHVVMHRYLSYSSCVPASWRLQFLILNNIIHLFWKLDTLSGSNPSSGMSLNSSWVLILVPELGFKKRLQRQPLFLFSEWWNGSSDRSTFMKLSHRHS